MTGPDLPDEAHVVRYVRPTDVRDGGKIAGVAFCLRAWRPDDTSVSVNWLECFGNLTQEQQVAEVRRLSRLTMRGHGRLAELNVGATKKHLRSRLDSVRFVHTPLAAKGAHEADPSHSEVTDLPAADSPEAELIGDMIAQTITAIYPAIQL